MSCRIAAVAGILLFALTPSIHAAVWYVDKDNTGAESGTSWAAAFSTIQEGIDAAFAAGGGEVWVAEGVYGEPRTSDPHGTGNTGSVMMRSSVHLYGGFVGTETARDQRDWTTHGTTINGSTSRAGSAASHVIVGASNATLDGFTISGGNAVIDVDVNGSATGGGMYNGACSPIVAHCVFANNRAKMGGGMMNNQNAAPTISDCTFSNNWAGSGTGGGGMGNLSSSSPTILRCTFSNNSADAAGGAIYNHTGCSPTIRDCVFSNNSVSGGTGATAIMNQDSSPSIVNTMFLRNSSPSSGGTLATSLGSSTVTNCVIYGNVGRGIVGASTVRNCIIWGNSSGQITNATTVTYSCVQDGYAGIGNIRVDPRFVNAAGNDFRLRTDSPCINAGTASGAPSTDILGVSRPIALGADGPSGVDMGVYEKDIAVLVDAGNVSGIEDGRSWPTAFTTIQDAVNAAATDGQELDVWVADGTYTDAGDQIVTCSDNVSIYGGFDGLSAIKGETLLSQRNLSRHGTIIDGQNTRRCVMGANNALLDGFVLRNGYAQEGAGLLNDGHVMTVRDCVFENNHATLYGGGACSLNRASTALEASHFGSNTADIAGGGVANKDNATTTLTNCILWNNTAASGAGAANSLGGLLAVMNSVFYDNAASDGGGAILNYATASLTNSILWSNAPDQISGVVTVTYCDVMGGEPGVGNIQTDPLFADSINGNFSLQIGSPCIDAAHGCGSAVHRHRRTLAPHRYSCHQSGRHPRYGRPRNAQRRLRGYRYPRAESYAGRPRLGNRLRHHPGGRGSGLCGRRRRGVGCGRNLQGNIRPGRDNEELREPLRRILGRRNTEVSTR